MGNPVSPISSLDHGDCRWHNSFQRDCNNDNDNGNTQRDQKESLDKSNQIKSNQILE